MDILEMLKGGDLRSIGKANDVAKLVCSQPKLVATLIRGMQSDDPVLRARSADALEKVSSQFPKYVEPFKDELLSEISKIQQQEVKWHVALILPRLTLSALESARARKLFSKWLEEDESSIVRVCSLQGLFDLTRDNTKLRPIVVRKLKKYLLCNTPSLRARSRKLLEMSK